MAGVTPLQPGNVSLNAVIDLTLSEDESDPSAVPSLPFRPLEETPAGEPSGTGLPDHGLLLDRDFGSFNCWGPGRTTSFLSRKLLKGGSSRLRRRITSKLPAKSNERGVVPSVREIPGYHASSVKRRRVELDLRNQNQGREHGDDLEQITRRPQIDAAEKTLRTGPLPPNSKPSSAQAIQTPQTGRSGNELSKGTMNEGLKIALRRQVFPYVNQRLSHYRLSIDTSTRRQLGKKAAWEICGEDFMNDLMQNDGRLSANFEIKVAVVARSLIDQYAAKFVKESKKGHCDSEDSKNELVLKENSKFDTENRREPRSDLQNSAKAVTASRKAKLSAAMKGRWARGEMDSVVASRAATLLLKKVGQNASQYKPGFSETRKRGPFQQPTITLQPAVPPILSGKKTNINLPRRRLIVKLRIKEPQRLRSILKVKDEAHALRQRRSVPKLEENGPLERRSNRHPSVKKIKSAAAVTHHPTNAPNLRRHIGTQKSVAVEDPEETHHQMENLRLAGLDGHISRPYLNWQARKDIERGLAVFQTNPGSYAELSEAKVFALQGSILHVDFCQEEIEFIIPVIESVICSTAFPEVVLPRQNIEKLMKGRKEIIPNIVTALRAAEQTSPGRLFRNRMDSAIAAFLQDATAGLLWTEPEIQRIQLSTISIADLIVPPDSFQSILRQRETWGRRRNLGICRSLKALLLNGIEDDYVRKAEWTDCSGDIATITWIDGNRFICGATTHSDEHNMQYNKPGNLLVGTAEEKMLKSVPGHQIVRPIVTKGENSLDSMRGTQDPWMYCSVTSTAFSHDNRKCFTGSYDQTVKVWDIAEDGSSMDLCGTWSHAGNVNFVVASLNHGLVATAADVREDAVRVYNFDSTNITATAFSIYEASVQRHNSSDTWAYFPSTMQWGISPSVSHLLLVGYSPRSFDCHDEDIPEDKLNSGELCLWDSRDGSRIPITTARTQNVFEVAWHPTQPIFVAATSPAGLFEDWVKTQLRVFEQKACGSFCHVKTLDCPAIDINEITIMPNSRINSYVTASCTDGNTYVWDSALSDKPLHVLRHGDSIDEYAHDEAREETDIGVKFAAWGSNLDRFYTGSSDGVLKAWNIRAPPGHEFIRDVIRLSGGISAGKFASDFSKLVLGDSTGKVHLLSLSQVEPSEESPTALRKPITPHPPLQAPLIDDDDMEIPPEQTARQIGQEFLDRGQIVIHEDMWVGAVQGPNYASTGLFYNVEEYKDEFGQHSEGWSTQELEEKQQLRYNVETIKFPQLPYIQSSSRLLHEKNVNLDLDLAVLSPETYAQLRKERVDVDFQNENDFLLELGPILDIDVKDGLLIQNDLISNYELQELHTLEQQICQELEIQQRLKNFFSFKE